jgi:hypothetical protein
MTCEFHKTLYNWVKQRSRLGVLAYIFATPIDVPVAAEARNMFAGLSARRRNAIGFDRCARTFISAICIAVATSSYVNR